MSFLSSLRPLLRGSASITITLAATADDGLSVVVLPKLDQCDPDTSDAARAALQAALARPIRLVIPAGADPDAEFNTALLRINEARAPVVDDLREYLDSLSQAQQTAKIESAKKETKKPAKEPAKKPAPSSAPSAPADSTATQNPDDDDAADGSDASSRSEAPASDASSTPPYASAADAISATTPAPAAAASLFD